MLIYLESLRHIKSLNRRIICPGHGPIITDPKAKLKELIDHRIKREEQVLKQVRDGITDTRTMMERIYIPENIPEMFYDWAEKQVLCHLLKLEKEGRVVSYKEGEETRYRPARGGKKK
jgi:glyoxylase-like metal-dependent hydrolase (beta-lactamase superfamily II)